MCLDEAEDLDSLGEALLNAWSEREWPEKVLGRTRWTQLFRSVGFQSRPKRPHPTSPIELYRGSSWSRRRSMAWTTDIAVAQRFAARWDESDGGPGLVFAITAEPSAILAMIDDGGEHEVVVDAGKLPPISRARVLGLGGQTP
jgi:hypothetical protein